MTRVTVQLQVPINVKVEVDELTENKILDAVWDDMRSQNSSNYWAPTGSDLKEVIRSCYFIQLDDDEMLHDLYLPIARGSEQIYIDDGVASNNQGGQRTVQGY